MKTCGASRAVLPKSPPTIVKGPSTEGPRALSGNRWLALFIICAAAAIGMLVIHANREHERRREAFLVACARAGHESGHCDFYWHTLAARARSNETALAVISSTPK